MGKTTLLLVRHGHTAANPGGKEARMSGWTNFPLSDVGRRQAEALHRRLAAEDRAVALYTSPLQRAADTARILEDLAGGGALPCEGLREISCGEVDGVPVDQVQEKYPDLWASNLRQDDPDFRWPGGESYRELRRRSLAAVRSITVAHPGERVYLVTHAGVVSQLIGAIRGTSPAEWERFRPGNCSLTELRWNSRGGELIRFDDREHLAGLVPDEEGGPTPRPGLPLESASTRPPAG
jgi:broad specificity phosphatase PhoE